MIYSGYLLINFICIFLQFFRKNLTPQKNIIYALFFITICIAGFRWKTGTDWGPYYNLFYSGDDLHDYLKVTHFEFGYKLLNWLGSILLSSYTLWLFLLTSTVLGIKLFVLRNRPYILLFFVVNIGVALADFFPTRQALAASIVLLAVYFYSNKQYLLFLLCSLFAFFIHKSALIIFLCIPVLILDLNIIILIAVFVGFLLGTIFFPLGIFLSGIMEFEYINYQLVYYDNLYSEFPNFFAILYKLIVATFVMYIANKFFRSLTRFELNSVKLFLFGSFFNIVSTNFSLIFNRVTLYFTIFEVIAVPALFFLLIRKMINSNESAAVIFLLIVFFVFYSFRLYFSMINYWDLYVPYESVFHNSHKLIY